MAPRLAIVIVSTRPSRKGPAVADWFYQHAKTKNGFAVELVDLKDIGLPLLDEPNHPRLQDYQHAHTRRWSAIVDAADAFVFVTPEYNHNPPATLINALDYLVKEWGYKPAAFVSYGGVSGGMRAAQAVKPLMTTLKMMPLPDAVTIPFFAKMIDDDGVFHPSDIVSDSADAMLTELRRWAEALKVLRQ